MSLGATATFTTAGYPIGVQNMLSSINFNGLITFTQGVYGPQGISITSFTNPTGGVKTPFKGYLESAGTGFNYIFDQTSQSIRIFEESQYITGGYPPALVASGSDFTIHANWGTGASAAITGNQEAFTATVTSVASGSGANPTLILTFQKAMSEPPTYVVDRSDAAAEAGYFVFTSSTTTTATFTFIGTPASAHVYVMNARAKVVSVLPTTLFGGSFILTQVAAGTGVYTGSITNGTTPAYVGLTFTVTGFTNAANNGTFVCTACSTTTLTLANTASVAETHAGLATSGIVLSSGWGTNPSGILTTNSAQGAFQLTITAKATTSANPSVTVTFPLPYSSAPQVVCSRGDALADAGYFVVTSSSATQVVFSFIGTPTATHVYILDALVVKPNSATLSSSNFVASANFGTSPTVAVVGSQNAFSVTITAQATTGASPTLTLTFPAPYLAAPQMVCSRGDSLSDTGYWAVTSTSTTGAVFTFIGTPTATHTYVLNAVAQTYSAGITELTYGQNLPDSVVNDSVQAEIYCTKA